MTYEVLDWLFSHVVHRGTPARYRTLPHWPRWLCAALTDHRVNLRWGDYTVDVSGVRCRCGFASDVMQRALAATIQSEIQLGRALEACLKHVQPCGYEPCAAVGHRYCIVGQINRALATYQFGRQSMPPNLDPDLGVASGGVQEMLERWWNEDPELRYVEVFCGDKLRVCVRLFSISMHTVSDKYDDCSSKVGEGEAATLGEAVRLALVDAKFKW